MATYKTRECYAVVSMPAFRRATGLICALTPGELIRQVLPKGWHLQHVERRPEEALVRLYFLSRDVNWTLDELVPLPCVGAFTFDGDAQGGLVSDAVRPLHDALRELFCPSGANEVAGKTWIDAGDD